MKTPGFHLIDSQTIYLYLVDGALKPDHHYSGGIQEKASLDMVKSSWVYKRLKNFRAGIEANISTLKRAFGLDRCTWKGWGGFKRYVWSSIFAYNLQVIARIKLESAKSAT